MTVTPKQFKKTPVENKKGDESNWEGMKEKQELNNSCVFLMLIV